MGPLQSVTIEALLRKYFCMEVIRGATCDRCKARTGKRDSGLFKKQGFSKVSTSCEQKTVYCIRTLHWTRITSVTVFTHSDGAVVGKQPGQRRRQHWLLLAQGE